MLPAKRSPFIAKSKEHFAAYNLLGADDHLLLFRTLHLDSRDLLLVLLLFFWLRFLSLHGLFFSIPCHPNASSPLFHTYSLPGWAYPSHSTFWTPIICIASPWFLPFPHVTCIYIYLVFLLLVSFGLIDNIPDVIGLVYNVCFHTH